MRAGPQWQQQQSESHWSQLIALAELALAFVAILGTGVATSSLLHGRSALFWPSMPWAITAVLTWLLLFGCWAVAVRTDSHASLHRLDAWHRAGWPALLLLPVAAAGAIMYVDEPSNHFLSQYGPARESVLAYAGLLFAIGHGGYWLSRSARWWSLRPAGIHSGMVIPAVIGIAVAAYLNASVFSQWDATQNDLRVNLRGARVLLEGGLPYDGTTAVWADRVHMLPATIVLLFGSLAFMPEGVARVTFFLANQALWLCAMGLLIFRLAPSRERWLYAAGILIFGAIYWPWQEAIRFGQQDGLLILLFVLSILYARSARPVPAGIALGLAFVVKPLSIWLPLVYLVHRQWRALVVSGCTALVLAGLTLPVTGWEPWWHFARVEVPAMLPGTVRPTNIPLPSLHARFFVGRERLSDGDVAPQLGAISAMNLAANVLGLLLIARLALQPAADRQRAWLLDACTGLTLTLLLAPMAWQHYASWLSIAFFVLCLPPVWRPLALGVRLAVGALTGSAFLLLGLDDAQLLDLLSPLIERWPGVLGFYTLGLVCLLSATTLARVSVRPEPSPTAAGGAAA
ncbi:MAG TPA: glycosyltransferase family 87 protein [Chloroflexota bacterium]|nr:glycosyltransferase family 87 protein [Chloroflexota bacterium]